MKYLIGYLTENAVKERDRDIAIAQGCHGDITEYWFTMLKHPERSEWGMAIPDDQEDKITAEEVDILKTKEYMDNDGWFPDPFAS